jgi:hypothetical protein
MHAVIVDVELDPARFDEEQAILEGRVIPMFTGQDGFASGRWFRTPDGKRGHATVLFDSEASARAARDNMPAFPEDAPVKLVGTEVFEVIAER